MENFDAVWERVAGSNATGRVAGFAADREGEYAGGSGSREALRGFMDAEASASRLYSALAFKLPAYSRVFARMAADERRHFQKNQLEYFLLYGDRYTPSPACPRICCVSSALREAYMGEKAARTAYLRAADEAVGEAFAESCRDMAACEAAHADKLRTIIEKIL